METELQSLQNLADIICLKVVVFNFNDKRKKPKYYVTFTGRDRKERTVSPVLSYDNLSAFILGFREGYDEAY
jgi:hypothetical protein